MKLISTENCRLTCCKCKAVFELEPGDVKTEYHREAISVVESVFRTFVRGRMAVARYYRNTYVFCPVCGEKHILCSTEISDDEYHNRYNQDKR